MQWVGTVRHDVLGKLYGTFPLCTVPGIKGLTNNLTKTYPHLAQRSFLLLGEASYPLYNACCEDTFYYTTIEKLH